MKHNLDNRIALIPLILLATFWTSTNFYKITSIGSSQQSENFAAKTLIESNHTHVSEKVLFESKSTKLEKSKVRIKKIVKLNEEIKIRDKEEKNRKKEAMKVAAKERKKEMKELAKENPAAFLSLAITKKEKDLLPPEVQTEIETETKVRGVTEIIHVDDFKNPERSYFIYKLKGNLTEYEWLPVLSPSVISNTTVDVSGFVIDDVVVSDGGGGGYNLILPAPPIPTTGDQKTLIVLLHYPAYGAVPTTKEAIRDRIFNGNFQNFMKEQSYNRVSFSGDITNWYDMPGYPSYGQFLPASTLKTIVDLNGFNLSSYSRILYIISSGTFTGGLSTVGPSTYVTGGKSYVYSQSLSSYFNLPVGGVHDLSIMDNTIAHEVGHGLGLVHANSLDCGTGLPAYNNCTHVEYGNELDIMGSGRYSKHFNAAYKEILGWILPEEIVSITDTGYYTIDPIESATSTAKFAKVVIPNTNPSPIYIEYRKPIGFDYLLDNPKSVSNQQGLLVNKFRGAAYLFDFSPGGSLSTYGVSLNANQSWSDSTTGLGLSEVTPSTSSLRFKAVIDKTCRKSVPLIGGITFVGPTPTGYPGDTLTVYLGRDFINKDSLHCPPSTFTMEPDLPLGWSYTSSRHTLFPDTGVSPNITITIPPNATSGDQTFNFSFVNTDTGLRSTFPHTINVKALPVSPRIDSITPGTGGADNEIILRGINFPTSLQKLVLRKEGSYSTFAEPAFVVSENGTKATFKIPVIFAGNNGNYNVYFRLNNATTSNIVNFQVAPPRIDSVVPSAEYINKDIVITGANLENVRSKLFIRGANSYFTAQEIPFTVSENNTKATFKIPLGFLGPKGDYLMFFTTNNATSSNVYNFTFLALPPVITLTHTYTDATKMNLTLNWTTQNVNECHGYYPPGSFTCGCRVTGSAFMQDWQGTKPLQGTTTVAGIILGTKLGLMCAGPGGVSSTTIQTPISVVNFPKGGEILKIGETYTINYALHHTYTPTIYLERYHPPGSRKTGVNISKLIGEPGQAVQNYTFTVPDYFATYPGLGGYYKIKICVEECAYSASSDDFFSITR